MAKAPYKPSPEQLEGARKPILYELQMLNAVVDMSVDCSRSRERPELGSALTDSALLDARNLYHFLTDTPSPKKKDDIVSGHFLRNKDGTPWTSSKLGLVKSYIEDINKFRSHLTYTRIALSDRRWPLPEIRDEIDAAFREFLALLPDSERLHWHQHRGDNA